LLLLSNIYFFIMARAAMSLRFEKLPNVMKIRRTHLANSSNAPGALSSFARQKNLLGHAQKIAFQSTAFWAIHPEARVLRSMFANRAFTVCDSFVFQNRRETRKAHMGRKSP
jgi:hypothetical protein